MTAVAEPAAALPRVDVQLQGGRRYAVRAAGDRHGPRGLAIFAVWANRQVLDSENCADTTSALLEEPAVQTQVAAFLVDSLYANVHVARPALSRRFWCR